MHNNYLTLPVVFLMLSNHYPLLYATRFNWLIVAIVLAIGPVIRQLLQFAACGQRQPVVDLGGRRRRDGRGRVAVRGGNPHGDHRHVTADAQLRRRQHHRDRRAAAMCHAAEPVWAGLAAPPKGFLLDTDEHIYLHAPLIAAAAVARMRCRPAISLK